jgi:predicted  nucleic acid-binding Zn-ribbon protein
MDQWQCQECGKLFRSTRAASRASYEGCPQCGGVDIDLYIDPHPASLNGERFAEEQES